MADVRPLLPLTEEQAEASAPAYDVWLTASAGTGKTQVLSARVLRLLLNGEPPESLLCLTFTKSGAAEMANRVHSRLAFWVRAPGKVILADLVALGEPRDVEQIAFARTLFARVLDARGGGLRIQTIHSFCQTLLASFPAEADLAPGFRPMEEREARKLAQSVLADLVRDAVAGGELGFIERLQRLVVLKGEPETRFYLSTCARASRNFAALGGGIEARVRRALGLTVEDVEPIIAQLCEDDAIDRGSLEEIRNLNAKWGTATGHKRVDAINAWLMQEPEARALALDDLMQVWLKKDGGFRSFGKGQAPKNADYEQLCMEQHAYFERLLDKRRRQQLAAQISDALLVGQRYASAYADAKRALGGVDFDDLIDITSQLLAQDDMGAWIRYKLDRSLNHILVDEAQDTNDKQWAIIKALADDFYSGAGQKGDRHRTIFTVGDSKQAIFGFQGTNPRAMSTARGWFEDKARGVDRDLLTLNLRGSFRSSPPILGLVDTVIEQIGAAQLGLDQDEPLHVSQVGRYGHVHLLRPVVNEQEEGAEETDESPTVQHKLARELATRVAGWLKAGLWIEDRKASAGKPQSRLLQPNDIMILLRSRTSLAPLIVAHLSEAGVPVAGVDRLQLNTPLVVRDVLAAMCFALQPADDLNLAELLVSPLLGWSQEQLRDVALARGKLTLWRFIRSQESEAEQAPLRVILGMGDRLTPARFIEALLSGDLRGREKLLARFGGEALDPLNELLNAAISFERENVPTLQGFVDWFERDVDDIKRDPSAQENAVRVLTAHGAKGLQAPLVILADATRDPEASRDRVLDWMLDGQDVPIPQPKTADRVSEIATAIAAAEARALEEHWRLLYVALTRAEERLVVMGTLGSKALSSKSWFTAVEQAMVARGAEADADGNLTLGEGALRGPAPATAPASETPPATAPDWLTLPAPQEARPPRPLAPSAYTDDATPNPPADEARRAAAQRGRILHALFERLPGVAADQRAETADKWLLEAEGLADAPRRAALIADALRVIDDPQFAHVFSADALAEAPVAGVIDGVVIAGTVDRLLVAQDGVTILDFKTMRRAPSSAAVIPPAHLRQMAAYVAVLSSIFPDRPVRAALLYTAGPSLFTLDADLLAAHKPSFQLEQQVLAAQT